MAENVKKRVGDITLSDAKIIFKNFSGKEGDFNPHGNRNFCVVLDEETAEVLAADGWNVKRSEAKEEGLPPLLYLPVAVKFNNYPPKIVMITSHGKTKITEDEVNTLDWADFKNVDLIINPYTYDVRGHQGIKAYLKALYVTIEEDEFESKYYDVPDTAENTIHCENCTGCGDCQKV